MFFYRARLLLQKQKYAIRRRLEVMRNLSEAKSEKNEFFFAPICNFNSLYGSYLINLFTLVKCGAKTVKQQKGIIKGDFFKMRPLINRKRFDFPLVKAKLAKMKIRF